ncbi:MAG TPA: hypothetical protein VI758_08655 [Bacteroidota bacterium]
MIKTTKCLFLSFMVASVALAQSTVQDALFNAKQSSINNPDPAAFQAAQTSPSRSVLLATMLSVVIPGTGELYAGNFQSGKYALMAEVAIWVTYGAVYTHGSWVRQDARLFATEHAGAAFNGKGDKFDVDIGNYASMSDYNQAKLRNRELDLLYTDPSYNWQWDSDAARTSFKNARIRSDQIYQNAKFVIAAAVVNRILSAFSAAKAASAYNKSAGVDGAWNIEARPTSTLKVADGWSLQFSYDF